MKSLHFTLLIVILCLALSANLSAASNDKINTARKFKEVKHMVEQLKGTQRTIIQEIMPKIEKAGQCFRQDEYQQAREILDGVIIYLKDTEKEEPRYIEKPSLDEHTSIINTEGMQDLPTISLDGKKLYFSYSPLDTVYLINNMRKGRSLKNSIKIVGPMRPPFTKKKIYSGQVHFNYVATKLEDGTWSEPEYIDFQEGDSYFYGIEDVSDDAKTALLFGNCGPNHKGRGDIYVSHKQNGEWSRPENLGGPVNTKYNEDNGELSSDGNVIYFDVEKPGGYGKYDIWMTEKNKDGGWSKPANLGPNINNEKEQKFPFINKENNRLYFSNEYQRKMRLFVSEKLNGEWQKPKLIDVGIEFQALASPSLTIDEKELYFYVLEPYSISDSGITTFDIYYSTKQEDGSWSTGIPID